MQNYILSVPNVPVGSSPSLSVPLVPVNQGDAGPSSGPAHSVPLVPDARGPRAEPGEGFTPPHNLPNLMQQNIHHTAVDTRHDINMASHVVHHEQFNQQVDVQHVHLQGLSPEQVSQVVDHRDCTHAA